MKDVIKGEIFKILNKDFALEKPKDRNLAHYATPIAFSLARELKKSPVLIAEDIAKSFNDNEFFEVSTIKGYINLKLKIEFLNSLTTQVLKEPENFAKGDKKDNSVLIEYVSANPTGPLHIGHVRGAVYGDTLARIGRHLGYEILTEYYINDAGNQIDLLALSLNLRAKELLFKEKVEYPEKYYRGEYIDELACEFQNKYGDEIFSDLERLGNLAKDEILLIIKDNLKSANIEIENWVSEKSLYNLLEPTLKRLQDNGGVYKKDEATYIASTKLGDDNDRVVVRNDGRPTYLAGDIVYHNDKFSRGFDTYINILGADHHGYINRLKSAVHFLGYNENNLEVILMQMVSLVKDGQPFKMSKRAGTSILMSDVVEILGSDVLRFMFVSKKGDSQLEIDVDEIKKEDSTNPVFYINYAHARVHQVFAKANKSFKDVINADLKSLSQDGQNLLFEALILPEVLQDAFESRNLQKIPDYLKSLSASFHKFYNENRVVGSQNEDDLLKLFALIATTIKQALNLIGINALEKMQK